MSEEVKTKRPRRPRVDVKISPTDYDKLVIYAASIKSKPNAIIDSIIEEFLEREDVKAVLNERAELIKLREELKRKEEEAAKIKEKIKEIESSQE